MNVFIYEKGLVTSIVLSAVIILSTVSKNRFPIGSYDIFFGHIETGYDRFFFMNMFIVIICDCLQLLFFF